METYTLVAATSALLFVESERYGKQRWRLVTVKKDFRQCPLCEEKIVKGALCYSPITNAGNRCHRMHKRCVDFELKSAAMLAESRKSASGNLVSF